MTQTKYKKTHARSRSRVFALQVGYLLDVRGVSDTDRASEMFEEFLINNEVQEDNRDIIDYAKCLVEGIVRNRSEIDALVRSNMTGWRPERMSVTDRVAVHLALFEGVLDKKVDLAVAISEAVKLARVFGSEESARFVNGVLGKIVRAIGIDE